MFKNIKVEGDRPVPEDVLREMNRGSWSTGLHGPVAGTVEGAYEEPGEVRPGDAARSKDDPEVGGDLLRFALAVLGHAGDQASRLPILYNADAAAMDGGNGFRARFGTERNGQTLLAEGSYLPGSEIKDGYPEFTMGVFKKLGWDKDLTPAEMATIEKVAGTPGNIDTVSWSTDLSGGIQRVALKHGCSPYGNAKARTVAWNLPDPIPVHREPIYTPRVDLMAKYPTLPDAKQFRLPNIGFTVQKTAVDQGIAKAFPLIVSSGRLVEYEGGGEETRSNKWLAELQQDMFIEIRSVGCCGARHQGRRLGLGDGRREQRQGEDEGAGYRTRRQGCDLDALPFRRLVRR